MVETSSMGSKPTHNIIIGIDPDTDRLKGSGWASINLETREVRLERLTIPQITRLLQEWETEVQEGYLDTAYTYRFVLENVWESSHNRHLTGQKSPQAIAKTGYNLGRCAMVGENLKDLIQEYGFPILCPKPLMKCWKGTDRKITHLELLDICDKHRLILPENKRKVNQTNQEERDALLLAIEFMATPLKLFNLQDKIWQ